MHSSFLVSGAVLVATAVAVEQFETTTSLPGLTMTLPVGIDSSTTSIVSGPIVTGEAAIISGVTVIVDAYSVYFIDGDSFQYGGAQGTHIFNSITVIDGVVPGVTDDSSLVPTTDSQSPSASVTTSAAVVQTSDGDSAGSTITPTTTGSTNSQQPAGTTGAPATTTKPNAGSKLMLGWGAAAVVGAAAAANL